MLTLFLDFGSHSKTIALIQGNTTLDIITFDERPVEAEILPKIEEMLTKNKSTLKDLSRIAAVTGPGGFMSLRSGLSMASALCWSLKIPIGGVHLSDLWLARIHHPLPPTPSPVIWLHSTKKDALFIRGFGELENEWPTPTLISIETLIHYPLVFVGELIPEHAEILGLPSASQVRSLADILPTILETIRYDKSPLLPWYGRGI